MGDSPDITRLLNDPAGAGALMPLVDEEHRMLAARQIARERDGHALSPTALVHEAYTRMAGNGWLGMKFDVCRRRAECPVLHRLACLKVDAAKG